MEYRDDDPGHSSSEGGDERTDQERATGLVDEELELKDLADTPTDTNFSSRPSSPSVMETDEDREKKPRVRWRLEEMKEPSWWPRMMWKEKGTFFFILFTAIFLSLMGTLVDGWGEFSWEVCFIF